MDTSSVNNETKDNSDTRNTSPSREDTSNNVTSFSGNEESSADVDNYDTS